MIRTLAGIAGGIAVAIVVMVITEAIGNRIFPTMALGAAQPEPAAQLPFETLIFPLIGWFVGPLAGGMLAVWSSRRRWTSWPVAAAVLIGAMLRFALASHPAWAIAAGLAAPLAAGWIAQHGPRRPRNEVSA
jgi:hypothetical protein